LTEFRVPALKATRVWPIDEMSRKVDLLEMNLLKTHDKHGAIHLDEDGRPHLDHVIGTDREEETVKRRVVKLAERDAIADDRLTFRILVWCDVRRVKKLLVAEQA